MTTMARIRFWYKVPAKRGMRVVVDGQPGIITGTPRDGSMHLNVRPDGARRSVPIHPTWRVVYQPEEAS